MRRPYPIAQLVAASFVTLATELVLIRWVPGEVRVIAYVPKATAVALWGPKTPDHDAR